MQALRTTNPSPRVSSNPAAAAAPRLLILADDLTGACDSAVAFAQRGLRTEVALMERSPQADDSNLPHADVLARSTGSRDVEPAEAHRRLAQACAEARLQRGALLFKKIDSVFRGNTFVEILSTIELTEHDLALVAPAYPELGRRSIDGVVVAADVTGESRIPVLEQLRARGLDVQHIAATSDPDLLRSAFENCLREATRVAYCDAAEQADLAALVTAAAQWNRRVLWIGSAGLAHALAANLPQRQVEAQHRRSGLVVIFAGSDHPVTQSQLSHLCAAHGVVAQSVCESEVAASAAREVLLLRVPRDSATEDDVRRAMQNLRPEQLGCLLLTGGDTAALVCRALGVRALRLYDEVAPGVPRASAVGGAYDGVPVILKSGGFGERDILLRICEEFSTEREKVA